MELETINKLFLELSQVATAQTAKEKELIVKNQRLRDELEEQIEKWRWISICCKPIRPAWHENMEKEQVYLRKFLDEGRE